MGSFTDHFAPVHPTDLKCLNRLSIKQAVWSINGTLQVWALSILEALHLLNSMSCRGPCTVDIKWISRNGRDVAWYSCHYRSTIAFGRQFRCGSDRKRVFQDDNHAHSNWYFATLTIRILLCNSSSRYEICTFDVAERDDCRSITTKGVRDVFRRSNEEPIPYTRDADQKWRIWYSNSCSFCESKVEVW